ncbi:uncharacterized protein LOC134274439 [Saccostrea cucullata]|uniref:uncharacterized protein LOC134274439 n=1 Tax=Saccostrea cuccullata TaxID=36930 RepID=UPI002ED1C8A6
MAFYMNLPRIAEERLYIDENAEYKYFQSDLSHEEWTVNNISKTRTPLNNETSYWMKLCQENIKEKSNVQQELVNIRIPMEARDVWKLKEFTMHEWLFETEEKLKDARRQFQMTASDTEDWASLEYLYWKRDVALKELEEMRQRLKCPVKRHPTHVLYNQGKSTKLPQIGKNFTRKTAKDTSRAKSTVLPPLEPFKAAQQRLRCGDQLQKTIDNDTAGAHSKLPIRNRKLSTEEFLSFRFSKKIVPVHDSKLPVPTLQKDKREKTLECASILGSLSENRIPLKNSLICSPVSSNSEKNFKFEKDSGREKHTDGKPSLPHLPSPPALNHRAGTSTHLRRRHFNSR